MGPPIKPAGNPPRWLWFILAAWLVGIVFPVYLPFRFWPQYKAVFEAAFHPAWVHILMHLVLFAGLAVLICFIFRFESRWVSLITVLGAALIVGGLQEGLQAWSQGIFDLDGILFDLAVDSAGTILGWVILRVGADKI